jgi:putative FmdB family regulatory protein
MPIYSYRCDKCGEIFDKLVKPGGNGCVPCVKCQSDTRRVFSPVGIIFKGSGFYSTDYKPGNKSSINNSQTDKKNDEKGQDKKPETGDRPKEDKVESKKPAK